MALKPVLSTISVAENSTSIKLMDATGEYSASNTGGFGSPNQEVSEVSGVVLKIASLSDLNYSGRRLTLQEQSDLFSIGGVVLTSQSLPGGILKFEDAVYNLLYNVCFSHPYQISFTPDQKSFTLLSAEDVFLDAVGFIIPSHDDAKIWLVDKNSLTNLGGNTLENLPAITSPVDIEIVYEGIHKVAVYKQGLQCLVKDIALWSDVGCGDTKFRNILNRYMMKIAIEYKFNKKLYMEAHNLILKLQSYCENCCS